MIRSLRVIAALAVLGLLAPSLAHPQTSGNGYVTEASMQEAQAEIAALSADLSVRIKATQGALQQVVNLDDIAEKEKVLRAQFSAIDHSVRSVLGQVSDNSFFMDTLMDARQRARRLKRSFEQRPADYPNRDAFISRLDTALLAYEDEATNLANMESEATQALISLGRAHASMIDELQVGAVEQSVRSLQQLTAGLGELVTKLDEIAAAQLVTSNEAAVLDQN